MLKKDFIQQNKDEMKILFILISNLYLNLQVVVSTVSPCSSPCS